jgi:hypothetical protein
LVEQNDLVFLRVPWKAFQSKKASYLVETKVFLNLREKLMVGKSAQLINSECQTEHSTACHLTKDCRLVVTKELHLRKDYRREMNLAGLKSTGCHSVRTRVVLTTKESRSAVS